MDNCVCFAYFIEHKFIGWYADTFGSVRSYPKLYRPDHRQLEIIYKNFHKKIKTINQEPYEQALEKAVGLNAALQLFYYDSHELLTGKTVELRIVQSPFYDGPNPDYNHASYMKFLDDQKELPLEERQFSQPGNNHWLYADTKAVRHWAAGVAPTSFIGTWYSMP